MDGIVVEGTVSPNIGKAMAAFLMASMPELRAAPEHRMDLVGSPFFVCATSSRQRVSHLPCVYRSRGSLCCVTDCTPTAARTTHSTAQATAHPQPRKLRTDLVYLWLSFLGNLSRSGSIVCSSWLASARCRCNLTLYSGCSECWVVRRAGTFGVALFVSVSQALG